MSADSNGEI